MLRRRLIPSLLINAEGHLVKTQRFSNRTYIGDPLNAAYIFSEYSADELLVLDIDASRSGKCVSLDFVKALARFTNSPLAIGGGIRTLQQIESILAAGVERVVVGAALSSSLSFVSEISRAFGSSSLSVIISVPCFLNNSERGYFGSDFSAMNGIPVEKLAVACAEHGAGEIILYDVEKDGTGLGFNVPLLQRVSSRLQIPLVAAGGYGNETQLLELFKSTVVSGVAIASNFVSAPNSGQVLLNYPSVSSDFRKILDGY